MTHPPPPAADTDARALDHAIAELEAIHDDVYLSKTYDEHGHIVWNCWVDCPRKAGEPAPEGTSNDLVTAITRALQSYIAAAGEAGA